MRIRSYSELRRIATFDERFEYLRLRGEVGESTFGHNRFINQRFYTSTEWKHVRNAVIRRDMGCDLGAEGYDIYDKIIVHHMNPMVPADIVGGSADILDPEFLVVTTHDTHNAIHYGLDTPHIPAIAERTPGDTKLWG